MAHPATRLLPRPGLTSSWSSLTPSTLLTRTAASSNPLTHCRPFLSSLLNQTSTPQELTAQRTLPYNHRQLYDLIADIDAYSTFLPYCKTSRVTQWTPHPDADGRRWPTQADLTAGWGGIEDTYTSRVFCIPGSGIVEAISGDEGCTEIPASVLAQHKLQDSGPPPSQGREGENKDAVFKSLITRWTITPAADATRPDRFQSDWSDVRLSIKFRFANPLYGAVSAAVADKVAPVMVDAFVAQARRILGEPGR
ncbi:Uu.00g090450.m01.CDS01 [Anthostomella pinea]|uniref:Uu.00g090450.m01.CDS01 n=1 Tax=Anthostomella pinea TaxID=933095 RepID=A0AAI8YHV8_9PEZI|nr:Uu.00g090450.m01.CDS01 [Anthostomella pinea]